MNYSINDNEFVRQKAAFLAKKVGAKRYNESSLITGTVLVPNAASYQFGVQGANPTNAVPSQMLGYMKFLKREDLFLALQVDVFFVKLIEDEVRDLGITQGESIEGFNTSERQNFANAHKGFLSVSQNNEVLAQNIPLLDFYEVANDVIYPGVTASTVRRLKVGSMAKTLLPYIVFSGEKSQELTITYEQAIANLFQSETIGILVKFSGILFPGRSSQLSTIESLLAE